MGIKKLKISSTKRSHHIRQKQSKKQPVTKNQNNKTQQSTLESSRPLKRKFKRKSNDEPKKAKNRYGAPPIPEQDEIAEAEDVLDMIDQDELKNLSLINVSKFDSFPRQQQIRTRKRKKADLSDDEEYNEHEKMYSEYKLNEDNKNLKPLLPIKTKDGDVIERKEKVEKKPKKEQNKLQVPIETEKIEIEDLDSDQEFLENDSDVDDIILNNQKSVSIADLLIRREQEISKQKYRIGIICSGILEKPEDKMNNFKTLLEFMEHKNNDHSLNLITVRKIAAISILELFKDIIPEYRIGFLDTKSQKMKKNTIERVTFENSLLQYYKKYLQKLEKYTSIISKKGKDKSVISQDSLTMGETCVKCLCDLLLAHPSFNFSQNIAQMLVYLSNNKSENIRKLVETTFIEIYKTDKKLDLSLYIIRRSNHLIKSKLNNVHIEVITPLIHLRIKNINLDAEKLKEIKQKKLEAHKSRLMNLSKREKKRQKKLKEVDKELQEANAEENKQTKHFKLTEITKMMFTIYFRILKNDPNSKLLSLALEGVAKFAHIINIDFFEDLVNVLNYLIENCELGYREQLHCIQTVFVILSGQGEAFDIDPCRFYTHLYKNLLEIHAGKNHQDLLIILKTLGIILIKRRKHITQKRLAAFIKRMSTLCLQIQHNGCLGLLSYIKNALQFNNTLDILLDPDNSIGSGKYDPELQEPEYCNADCTALYELPLLNRHYHPTVRKFAKHIASGVPSSGIGSLPAEISKLSAEDFFTQFDSSEMGFNPAIPAPKNVQPKSNPERHIYLDSKVEDYCKMKLKLFAVKKQRFNFCYDYWSTLDISSIEK